MTAPVQRMTPADRFGALVSSMRPRQWIKNVLVFAAPAAAGMLGEAEVTIKAALAFVVFCAASSATYLVNDMLDVERDQRHPTKRYRPIAAGAVSNPLAIAAAVALAVGALAVGFLVSAPLGLTVVIYLVLTSSYTAWLKHIAVLDVLAVAAGFVLRAIAGGAATGVPISEWFFIVTSAGALFMVGGKRASEVAMMGERATDARPILDEYSSTFLVYLRSVSTGVLLVSYCLWAFNSSAAANGGSIWFQISILPFTAAILRYGLLIDQGEAAEPERLVLSDRVLLGAAAAWAAIYGFAVYVG